MKKLCVALPRIILSYILILILLYSISYHEKIDYTEISSIILEDSKPIICTTEDEIRDITNRISKINFYPSKSENLQDSPDNTIIINYKDGRKKIINISYVNALFIVQSSNGDIIEELSEFYYVTPIMIDRLYDKYI